MEETKESKEFWDEKVREIGKEITFKSFTRFIGEKGKGPTNLSGLLFATDERVYFEDFEKTSMLDIFMKKHKKKYEKFTMNFLLSDVKETASVSEASAMACINGEIEEGKNLSLFMKIFNRPVAEIRFKSGSAYFFEIFETAAFAGLFNSKN